MTQIASPPAAAPAPAVWYRGIDRVQWSALLASNLGWLFDGFETYALILTAGPALRTLLSPDAFPQIPAYVGAVVAMTLLGWGIGGIIGGVLADYIGRKRTMVLAILAYSLLTGLTAFAFDWMSFAALRFLVGIAIGSEWATGASIVAETWPDRARGKGVGLMQCGLGIGFFLASFIWLFIAPLGPEAWRVMFLVGVLPALLTFWIRTSIPEPSVWERANSRRQTARERQRRGETVTAEEQSLIRFTMADLFVERKTRQRVIVIFLMSLATTVGWWGISSWIPPYLAAFAAKAGLPAQQWATYGALTFNLGGLLGIAAFGFIADRFGRKATTLAFFAIAFATTWILFRWTQDLPMLLVAAAVNGFFCMGQFSWMPVWLPELFPTHMRATALAFAFNAPRLIAFLGPLLAGMLIVNFGGYGRVATILSCIYVLGFAATPFLSETRGKTLPDHFYQNQRGRIMRVVTIEEHVCFAAITDRIDKAAIIGRAFVPGASRPGSNPLPRLEDVGEGRLKSMDANGISVQVLSVSGPGAELLDGNAGVSLARDYNDAIFAKVKAHPTRFAAFAHLPLATPPAAANELERAIKELGFCGALINGMANDRFLDDRQFDPILERAEALEVPLYLHPALPPKAVRDVYYAGMSPLTDSLLSMSGFGWHAETAIHTLRLIVSGTLDRFPKLQIIIGRAGEMLPMMMARCDGVFAPEIVGIRRSVQQTLRDQVHVTSAGIFSWPPLRLAIDTFGIDRVMFSIDYPYGSNEVGKKLLERLPLAPADVEKIAHLNAARLLRLTCTGRDRFGSKGE